jgi:hypothetical protein
MTVPLPVIEVIWRRIPMNTDDTATAVFYRPAGVWRDRFRSYRLYLDGQMCGTIRPGREVSVVVSPGHHIAQARIDWNGSPEVEFDIHAAHACG